MLEHDISAYSFFQAVRLLTENQSQHLEKISFKAFPSLKFPATEILSLEMQDKLTLSVSFLSMIGSMGLLPLHYTEKMLKRLQEKDSSSVDFLDIFHHEAIQLFYLAWRKYRLYLDKNVFNNILLKLTGFRQLEDPQLLFYAQYFSNQHRTSEILSQLLSDYFSLSVKILSLQGEWLKIEDSQRSKLSASTQLGVDMAIGDRFYSCQHKFRIQVGPLSLSQFEEFLPHPNSQLNKFCHFIRLYIGQILDFDIQFLLYGHEINPWKFNSEKSNYFLGWNMWLGKKHFPPTVGDLIIKEIKS